MTIATTLRTAGGAVIEAASRRRSAAELLLAYLVWGLGVVFLFGPLDDLISGTGAVSLSVFLLVYPLLIQLPILIHYDRRLGFTARPHRRMGFFGARLFHPLVIYGLFLLVWIWVAGLLTGLWGPLAAETADGGGLGRLFALIFLAGGGIVALIAYFPLVTLSAYLLKWGQRSIRRVSGPRGSNSRGAESGPRGREGSELGTDEPRGTETPEDTGVGAGPVESSAEDSDSPEHGPAADQQISTENPNVRFASLLGLIIVPIGAGWYAGRPEAGISVASLVLTVYEMAYRSRGSG